jgi:hypothetical protein
VQAKPAPLQTKACGPGPPLQTKACGPRPGSRRSESDAVKRAKRAHVRDGRVCVVTEGGVQNRDVLAPADFNVDGGPWVYETRTRAGPYDSLLTLAACPGPPRRLRAYPARALRPITRVPSRPARVRSPGPPPPCLPPSPAPPASSAARRGVMRARAHTHTHTHIHMCVVSSAARRGVRRRDRGTLARCRRCCGRQQAAVATSPRHPPLWTPSPLWPPTCRGVVAV